jgi:hypothetical protein
MANELKSLTLNGKYYDSFVDKTARANASSGGSTSGATEVTIPSYWKSAVTAAEAKIEELQALGGADAFSFGFITDTHTVSYATGEFADLMEHVMDACNIPLFLHGGDFISGRGVSSKEEHIKEIKNHDRIFKNIEDRCLLAMGNHDAVFGQETNYDSSLTDGEVYNYIFRKNEQKSGLVYGDPKTYFYKDIPAQKVRYVVLNCYDFKTNIDDTGMIISDSRLNTAKLGSVQLSWLANTALKLPEGYSAVICSHAPPLTASELREVGWSHALSPYLDVDIVRGIISAYQNKTVYTYTGIIGENTIAEQYNLDFDFSTYSGDLICWISGHTHRDRIFNLSDGLRVVSTANCSSHIADSDAPEKVMGTDTEYVMDFLCVNKKEKSCKVVRLGAKLSEKQYTNRIDRNDESYTVGYRINASKVEVAESGHAISNYIPVVKGNVLHMKGWELTNKFVVAFYNAEKQITRVVQYPGSTDYWNTASYANDVTCFVCYEDGTAYVRISGKPDTASEQIVTVNEKIEGTTYEGRGFNY